MKIEHSTVALLTIPRADLTVMEVVIVIIIIGILDMIGITVIKIQEIKQLVIKINGDAESII